MVSKKCPLPLQASENAEKIKALDEEARQLQAQLAAAAEKAGADKAAAAKHAQHQQQQMEDLNSQRHAAIDNAQVQIASKFLATGVVTSCISRSDFSLPCPYCVLN